jgi:two-component system sensor histidine kinase FlrB
LAAAFASFTASADELQRSYTQWSAEMAVLRLHLQQKEAELARERERSRHLRALAEVAAVLAHEVRNPLASMELFAGLLAQSDKVDGDEHDWVIQLLAGFRQLHATVSNVLHFHSSGRKIEFAPIEISRLVRQVVEFIQPLAERANVRTSFTDQAAGAFVAGNSEQLSQVLLNLAVNSIHATAGDGALAIRVVANDEHVEISVQDSGPGISADIRSRLFEPGFTTRAGSAGLGLAVCKRIVVAHGGTICVIPGQPGAMFVVRVPRLQDDQHA